MNIRFKLLLLLLLLTAVSMCFGQEGYHIQTIFKAPNKHANGGFGAISNKFTRIRGEYANIAEVYGGWYINHRFLLGLEGAAVTNNLPVPAEYSLDPFGGKMSYQYGQFGLMTEYTLWSDWLVHVSFHVVNGAGFTLQ